MVCYKVIMDQDMWIINKKVYDFKNFSHPGGDNIITNCKDMDSTDIFLSYHSFKEKSTMNRIQKYYVGTMETVQNNTPFFRTMKLINHVVSYIIFIAIISILFYCIFMR